MFVHTIQIFNFTERMNVFQCTNLQMENKQITDQQINRWMHGLMLTNKLDSIEFNLQPDKQIKSQSVRKVSSGRLSTSSSPSTSSRRRNHFSVQKYKYPSSNDANRWRFRDYHGCLFVQTMHKRVSIHACKKIRYRK